jgi:type II secretory pathway component PulL
MARWQSANLLHTSIAGRRFWQLSASGDHFNVQAEKALLANDPLPPGAAAKDWQTLFRAKLNIAWLPPEKVFLRAVQLPPGEATEISQMVELQMEKLSPLPVTHVVWSVYPLPRPADKPDALQTVIVIIAARSAVEEYLGQLEAQGFLADRLEAPGLDQLLALDIHEEGVWLVPGAAGEPALVAWCYGGSVQNVTLVALPSGQERGLQLRTQIEQIAWAGELEGWLPGPPKIHLVAIPTEAGFWVPIFEQAGDEIRVVPPPPEAQLVARSAQRCANSAATNLLPPEFATRYRQQFVDGLWLRGLFTVLSLYIIGVLVYFGALYSLKSTYNHVKSELAGIGQSFTNAQKDSEQLRILQDRQLLKFAALDCYKALAEHLPEGVTIDDVHFDRQKFELRGTAGADDRDAVENFNEELRHVPNPSKPAQTLFAEVSPPTFPNLNLHNNTAEWRFTCKLKETGGE